MSGNMDYTIVIATRNRPAALRLSIPRMLAQSRPPAQLIVIDSSDDHAATAAAVRESVGDHPVELIVRPSARGLTLQRNASLDLIRHPVVFFPDDDSIWFPGVAEAKMAVYELDPEEKIAAVCAAESSTPPPDWDQSVSPMYSMRRSHRIQQRVAVMRASLENLLVPDPARVAGRSFWPPFEALPPWFTQKNVVLVEWMTGFRMSYRTKVIRQVRFDETFTRYSLFEDIDASFGAWKHGQVVGARCALVYHYRSPERRDNGRRLGVEQLLNKAYVVVKHTAIQHPARRRLVRFARYKAFQYRVAAVDQFGQDRYQGAKIALEAVARLAGARVEAAAEEYLRELALLVK